MQESTKKLLTTRNIAKIAILAAIAFILMLIEFPVPFAPSFYKLDFSEVAVLMGGFAMGPLAAVAIEGLKIVLELLFRGTVTMGVGELANFLVGCALCVPAAVIYKKNKTRKSALKGMLVGTICMVVVGVILNIYLLIPAYVAIANFPLTAIIEAGTKIFPAIHDVVSLALICVVPFNLVKGIAVALITTVLYKHVSPLLHR